MWAPLGRDMPINLEQCVKSCRLDPLIYLYFVESKIKFTDRGNEVQRVLLNQEDMAIKIATENCVSASAKIISNPIDGLGDDDSNQMLEVWVLNGLPIEVDIEETKPTYGLLLEQIAR
ncbi:uncharacterized protein MELLADRAFT_66680 [Melampsora larici-populina 98AG31]|uniref:Uncharacterized protein n=1 Tax=Melampsora larici-populina (strain 98AG31 / pathotype 3-4-7) TaxID=747676 RepID=F4S067_MELLP|nr:uncharacterized protein MELLADRAFT_66680 [Melampsora larici-populina 98AG31]EGG01908.1 hypothetical protein MELLADRAFT_66680 [Melampsora larici-populina 98AG31]